MLTAKPSKLHIAALMTTDSNSQIASKRLQILTTHRTCTTKQATGKLTKKSTPLKSKTEKLIKYKDKQMGQWVKYYLELYSSEKSITKEMLDDIEGLLVLGELDSEPTEEKLSKVIDALAYGKASDEDVLSPEFIKCNKPNLLKLHSLLITLYKKR